MLINWEYYKFCSYRQETMSLEEYKDWCVKNKLVADEAFQANSVFTNKMGGTGRWALGDGESYMFNLVRGKAPSAFVMADNKTCHVNATKDNRLTDAKYFDKWGASMMVLDSWNRNENLGTTTINDKEILLGFFGDKIKLKSGNYEVYGKNDNPATGSGKKVVTISDGNNVYSKLPKLMKEHIKYHVMINLIIYENLTQEECSEVCRNVNLGVQWTTELFRNTVTSITAGAIRLLPKKYKDILLSEG